MRVERFAFDLPPELIAQSPAPEREGARLLVVDDEPVHAAIADLPRFVAPGTLVVVNDTKVLRARILGQKEGSGGKAEIFLLKKEPTDGVWRAMARSSKPLKPGGRVVNDTLVVTIEGKADDGFFLVRLETRDPAMTLDEALQHGARMPLPPYIKRPTSADDEARYQTVYAREPGAVAAPTAGLHMTDRLLAALKDLGCEVAACTLHVGLGTFEPVKTEDLDDHKMHSESFVITPDLAAAIARARERGAPVLAIGTTCVRALESAADPDRPGHVVPQIGDTRILIQPGYRFRVVDRLLTNFHLPKSTLLALVSAFTGTERVLAAYELAVRERYRFFSYGDAMLLTRSE